MRMRYGRYLAGLLVLGIALLFSIQSEAAAKKTIYNSPYVSFSPDGRAFTTCAGDRNYVWYARDDSTTVYTQIPSSLRDPVVGEHIYTEKRYGEIPVRYWKVVHRSGQCIHNGYTGKNWHGVSFGRQKCMQYYYSGWKAYCADCGEAIEEYNIYMSREAAASIQYLDLGNERKPMSYYYLCPFCDNLEQGVDLPAHKCKNISWNQYKVCYQANTGGASYNGYMDDSIHMYNDAIVYEGKTVTPVTHLTENNYSRTGYLFAGWNTEPDGSGTAYADKAAIENLRQADWRDRTTWTDNDHGVVNLYAQWVRSESTLVLYANGGKYDDREIFSVTQPYLERYLLQEELVCAPDGYTVCFRANGGSEITPVQGKNRFVEWKKVHPFRGSLDGKQYIFDAPDGNVDRLTAVYQPEPVTLPETTRPGWSFGGWYYDSEFRRPAGGAGDSIIPSENTTLYAQWVDLTLLAKDNYKENEGKGAVDLSWEQTDHNNKTYLIYQRLEDGAWMRINSATDINSGAAVELTGIYEAKTRTYNVPYTGLYVIKAMGAQGQGYGSFRGGCGGSASGTFWLQRGEQLTYAVGGQNGYNKGGRASNYGNGGGMTSVVSDRKGILLIAGGGGGASPGGAGGKGGSMESVLGQQEGEAGMAGGGAGYYGGTAGEKIVHHHTNDCYRNASYTPTFGDWEYFMWGSNCFDSSGTNSYQYNGHTTSTDDDEWSRAIVRVGWARNGNYPKEQMWNVSGYRGIPTNGNTTLNLSYFCDGWGSLGGNIVNTDWLPDEEQPSEFVILDQKGTKIAQGKFRDYPFYDKHGGGDPAASDFRQSLHISLPEGTTHIYVHLNFHLRGNVWFTAGISSLSFSGGRTLVCGYTEGQVLFSKPAYGGSNYVNPECALLYESESGVRSGDGLLCLQSKAIGYQETLQLKGVRATDLAVPGKIPENVVREALDSERIRISWTQPEDYGTVYYHRAESYLTGSTSKLCDSNIAKNTLLSGIRGYYYLVDQNRDTVVTDDAGYCKEPHMELEVKDGVQYLHVAAVDVAGNVSETTHICVDGKQILWKLHTKQLKINEAEGNVYPAAADKTWYVRADGKTPFTLTNASYMEGTARPDYQLNGTIYETVTEDGGRARNIIVTPSAEITDDVIRTDAEGLSYATEGTNVLQQHSYSYTLRSHRNQELTGVQQFVISGDRNGQTIRVIPVAEADHGTDKIYSVSTQDQKNGIALIADGEAPVIRGMEILENRALIDRRDGAVTIRVTATDALSGVDHFTIVISNTDNAVSKTYLPGEDGCIVITITEDEPLFSGDFTVLGYASDHVGNESRICYGTTEFALESSVKRILEPQEPVFKCGESGILTFTTWGYADRVEVIFPECMTALDPTLNKVYDYTESQGYRKTEELEFMVPLYTPENQTQEITVRAFKGDKRLEDHPTISVIGVSGNVLDELRTRLR